MPEKLVFGTPQQVAAAAGEASLLVIYKRRNPWIIRVDVLDDQGRLREFTIEGDTAQGLIIALNKTNNNVKSEERRILEWLQANTNPATGATYLPSGTYSGTPD